MTKDIELAQEQALFSLCLDNPPSEWDQLLETRCDDPDLRERVRGLLQHHRTTPTHDSGFLRLEGGDPERIGPYRILQRLGEGGMGIVYAAEQREPVRRRVAIKVLRSGYNSREVLARFDVERQALSLMNHANIARILDAGTTADHRPYIVMEFVPGEAVTRYCEQHGLALRERLLLFRAVCDAVHHAHQKGVIHRDLKPSNILVMEEDGKPVPKIIDFGIAKAITVRLTDHTLETKVGSLLGTPDYMSPEQAELSPLDVDTRADVYALGAVLYQLLTGVPPLQLSGSGKNYSEIQRAVIEQVPAPPSQRVGGALRRHVRGDLDWIALKALEKQRAQRYASAAELATDIRNHLRNETILAGPPSRMRKAGRFVYRHWLATASVCAIAVTLAVSQVMLLQKNRELERQRDRANIEAKTSASITAFLLDIFDASDPANPDKGKITARELLDRGRETIETDKTLDPVVRVHLLTALGEAYGSLGLHEESIALYRQAIAMSAESSTSSERLHLLGKLGLALQLGRHPLEARDVITEAMQTPGWENLDFETTFDLRRALATAEQNAGNLDKSVGLLESLLEDARSHFGHGNRMTLDVGARLVFGYSTLARYHDAVTLTDELLPVARRELGADDPMVSYLQGNLGSVYMNLDRWDEAERIYRRIYERFLEQFGSEASPTQITEATLAVSIRDREEGLRMLRELEARQRRQYGEDAPQLVFTLQDLAWVLSRIPGREAEAKRQYDKVLALAIAHFGEQHPSVATINYGLAVLEARAGKDDAALALFRKASMKPNLQFRASRDPDFAALRDNPEFIALLGRFGDDEPVLP